jgi:RES domain-containing protein
MGVCLPRVSAFRLPWVSAFRLPPFERVLDLRDGYVRRSLVVSAKRMLSEPWREEQNKGREALTQAIGRLAYELDVQALLVPSAARKGGSNLIVFPANLDPPNSWLRIANRDELPRKG